MKLDVNQKLYTIDGVTTIKDNVDGEAVDATLRMVLVNALLSPVQNEKGMDKAKKYDLAMKIYQNAEIDVNEDDIKMLKGRVGDVFPPLITGQVYKILFI